MQTIVLATKNKGKVAEFKEMLRDYPVQILSICDFDKEFNIVEDGESFAENALKKARVIAEETGYMAVADDSGLEVDALDGKPGIYSARFAGENATDKDNNDKLLKLLHGIEREGRTARFQCAIALIPPQGDSYVFEGKCEGLIGFRLQGEAGFGYDPLFIIPAYGKTFAELGSDIKNTISHRAKAMQKAKEVIISLVRDSNM